jgi:hypothetical protein
MTGKRKAFELSGPAPTAGGGLPLAGELQSSRAQTAPAVGKPLRTGFTWRQTAVERDALDDLTKAVSRSVGRSVDKAAVLAELVALGTDDQAVFATLVAALKQ